MTIGPCFGFRAMGERISLPKAKQAKGMRRWIRNLTPQAEPNQRDKYPPGVGQEVKRLKNKGIKREKKKKSRECGRPRVGRHTGRGGRALAAGSRELLVGGG